jgi:hypothetical protein
MSVVRIVTLVLQPPADHRGQRAGGCVEERGTSIVATSEELALNALDYLYFAGSKDSLDQAQVHKHASVSDLVDR